MEINQSQQLYLQIIEDLHKEWSPHTGQLEAGKAMLSGKADTVFLQCGRKFGKTEFAIYMLWRHALLNPGASCYYVAPEFSHAKKILWTDPRLPRFGGHKYVDKLLNNECIIRFKNGSTIQLMGSENYAAANGLSPSFLVYDEFCEFQYRFHETMNPNRAVKNCPLLIIGTPPRAGSKNKDQYIEYADECQKSSRGLWMRRTGYENPHVDPEWFDREKERLFARGEEWIWYNQYEARLTAGGKHVIFPMLSRDKNVQPHSELINEIRNDIRNLEWYCVSDPGTTTVMAFLFVAINPYSKKVYILDEIYEKDAKETSVRLIIPRVEEKCNTLAPRVSMEEEWYKVYDEAAAWFANEVMQQFGYYFQPTLKVHNKKENGISLIKDMLVHQTVVISDRCENLLTEMENYVADDQGRFPKTHDHLIDCFRYMVAAAHYSMIEIMKAKRALGARIPGGRDPHGYQDSNFEDDNSDWTSIFD